MIFVDTGYLLALLSPRDELFARAQRWATSIHEPLVTTEYVLWELVNAMSAPIDRPKAHAAVAEIRSSKSWEVIIATPDLFSEGLSYHAFRSDKDWSLTDCISFINMQQRGLQFALAYDHHFEQAGFEALLRRDPSEVTE
jgi:predicted nucleic acid-binding protein